MKKTIMLYAIAASGLAMFPVYAEPVEVIPAVEQQEVKTVSAYIVQVLGKG